MSTENYLRELRWKEINALRAENAKLREALAAHERFFKKLSDRFWDCYEVDAGDFQEWGVECGLLKIEPYDPEKHGECDCGSEPGDDWYVPSSIARAALTTDKGERE